MENIEKPKQNNNDKILDQKRGKPIYILIVFMFAYYGLWHLEFMKEFANSANGIALFDSIAKIVPSVEKLKQATNFTYPIGLMHATVWIFVPFLIWWGYFLGNIPEYKKIAIAKLETYGMKMQILMIIFLYGSLLYEFFEPLEIHKHRTDERFFGTGIIGLIELSCIPIFTYFSGGMLVLIKLKIKQRLDNRQKI